MELLRWNRRDICDESICEWNGVTGLIDFTELPVRKKRMRVQMEANCV